MKLKHLKKKSIINVYNGNFLGYISDIVISLPSGNVETLVVKQLLFKRIINFMNNNKYIISWNNIVSIGKDVILVNIIEN